MACISKTVDRRAIQSEIWDSWVLVTHIWGIYDLVVFKVILGSFGAIVSKWPVCRKWLVVVVFKVILGSFGSFVSKWPVCRKWLVVVAKRSQIWDSWSLLTHIWGSFDHV